jgi:excisionase family DNA binding protein
MGDEFLPLMQAASYLGVSRMKLSRMVREGELAYVTSPLDKRVKLFRRTDLDQLRSAPRPARPQGPADARTPQS